MYNIFPGLIKITCLSHLYGLLLLQIHLVLKKWPLLSFWCFTIDATFLIFLIFHSQLCKPVGWCSLQMTQLHFLGQFITAKSEPIFHKEFPSLRDFKLLIFEAALKVIVLFGQLTASIYHLFLSFCFCEIMLHSSLWNP